MFDVSFTELMVIGVIALIVIGPERLPKVARTVGHLLGRAQRYVSDVKSDIKREIELDELRKFKSEMEDAAQTVNTSMRDTEASLRKSGDTLRSELDATARDAASAVTHDGTAAAATASIATPAADPLVPSTTLPLTDAPEGAATSQPTASQPATSQPTATPPPAPTPQPAATPDTLSPTDAAGDASLSKTGSIYSLPVAALPVDALAVDAAAPADVATAPVAPPAPKTPGMSPIAAMPPIDSPAAVPAGTDAKVPPSSGTAT